MTRPTYRIPAEQVVPGMIVEVDFRWLGVIKNEPGPRANGLTWIHCMNGTGMAPGFDQMIRVQLPGPSPRELCTCFMLSLHGGWQSEHDPAEHADDCPVSPNADRSRGPVHGGLRLWPASTPMTDIWERHTHGWKTAVNGRDQTGGHTRYARIIADPQIWSAQMRDPHLSDLMIQCFYLPPTPAPEAKPLPTPWDPEPCLIGER